MEGSELSLGKSGRVLAGETKRNPLNPRVVKWEPREQVFRKGSSQERMFLRVQEG